MQEINKEITINDIHNFKGTYPKQIWSLFFSEMWERFCFYGLRGMLTYFMVYVMMMDSKTANLQYGATQAWVYAFTFIGGMIADKILGFQKSLFWGAILMVIGGIVLMIDPKVYFFIGLSFFIIGTGFFKPNISSMVGQLYQKGDKRRDAGFSLFYSGINIGAFLGGILMIGIGKGVILKSQIPSEYRWNVAFGLVALAMIISLITFVTTRKKLGPIGISPFTNDSNSPLAKKWVEFAVYIGALICIPLIMKMVSNSQYTDYFMYVIGPFSLLYLVYEMSKLSKEENNKIIAALVFIIFSVVFWAIFEQAGGSLSLYAAEHLNNQLLTMNIDGNIVNNSANSLFVIIFAPLIGIFWLALNRKNKEPNSILKFGIGFILLGLGFYIFYGNQFLVNSMAKASLNIFTIAYFVVTMAELAISPIGLSLMTRLSPKHLQGYMMGMWFLASAYGQYVAGLFGASISPDKNADAITKLQVYSEGYKQFGLYAIIAGVLILLISPIVKKLMMDEK